MFKGIIRQLEKTVGNTKNFAASPVVTSGAISLSSGKGGTLVYGANRENKTWLPVKESDVIISYGGGQNRQGSVPTMYSTNGFNDRSNQDPKFPRLSNAVSK